MFQHTATRRWLQIRINTCICHSRFQHTATRRWLPLPSKVLAIAPVVSTHSHPKVAARILRFLMCFLRFQHTATRRWLRTPIKIDHSDRVFQHTATRRWLPSSQRGYGAQWRFNTQPPEGGCGFVKLFQFYLPKFQHTATRRWLRFLFFAPEFLPVFQHTATRRWLLLT